MSSISYIMSPPPEGGTQDHVIRDNLSGTVASNPAYRAGTGHRNAALEDSRWLALFGTTS
jgi:hypothetical protein